MALFVMSQKIQFKTNNIFKTQSKQFNIQVF